MQRKFCALALAMTFAASAAFASPSAVTVNGKTITVAEQEKVINQIVKNGQKRTPELEFQVRNQMIQQEVLLQESERLQLSKRAEVKDQLKTAREQVLINALIAEFAKKNTVYDADVKKFYEEQKKAYGEKEYKISIITVKNEADAKNVVQELKDGMKFEKAVKKYTIDENAKKVDGKIDDWRSSAAFAPMIGYSVRNLDKGHFTEIPVRVGGVFHIIKVDDVRKAQLFPSYDKSKDHYRNMLIQTKVQENIQSLFQKAKIKTGGAK